MAISINKSVILSKIFMAMIEGIPRILYACSILTRIGRTLIEGGYPEVTIIDGSGELKVTLSQ